jgi:hypothetical protein
MLQNERRQIAALTRTDRLDVRHVERDLLQRVEEWRTAASRNVAQGRQVIRKLLGGERVAMRPLDDGTCELSSRADYGKLFSGIVAPAVASSTGFEPYPQSPSSGSFGRPDSSVDCLPSTKRSGRRGRRHLSALLGHGNRQPRTRVAGP